MTHRTKLPSWQFAQRRVTLRRLSGVEQIGPLTWCHWLNDPEVRQHLESKGDWTPERLREWFADNNNGSLCRVYAISVNYRVTTIEVGTLKLDGVRRGGWPSVGLMIGDKSVWGKGVGTEAITKACRIAHRAGCWGGWAGIRVDNIGSRRAFNRAGFRQVGLVNSSGRKFWRSDCIFPEECPEMVAATGTWSPKPDRMVVMRRLPL